MRIAYELRARYGPFAFSTVGLILRQAALSGPAKTKRALPVGRHRTQMDEQQLPATKGSQGFEYKILIIHLATRVKYSEIHDNYESLTIAGVFKRSLDSLPLFYHLHRQRHKLYQEVHGASGAPNQLYQSGRK